MAAYVTLTAIEILSHYYSFHGTSFAEMSHADFFHDSEGRWQCHMFLRPLCNHTGHKIEHTTTGPRDGVMQSPQGVHQVAAEYCLRKLRIAEGFGIDEMMRGHWTNLPSVSLIPLEKKRFRDEFENDEDAGLKEVTRKHRRQI
jgi:hypothetical protein